MMRTLLTATTFEADKLCVSEDERDKGAGSEAEFLPPVSFKQRSEQGLCSWDDDSKTFEIHYLHYGKKRTLIHYAPSMTDFDAWFAAAIACGVPEQTLPGFRFLTLLVTAAEIQGITKVRWNLAPRQHGSF